MSADGSLTIPWPDRERIYRLRLGEIRELQEKCGAGIYTIARRVRGEDWYADDLIETLRLSLIGGGLTEGRAYKMAHQYAAPGCFDTARIVAMAILQAAISGDKDDEIKKNLIALLQLEPPTPPTQTASTSAASTDQEPSWDGPRAGSTNSHSLNSPPQ